ncbi:NADPH-dependent FMN reductase [Limosilactobacillus caecicola]|uniref:NADPH-dependent FMN reductase n=1 Tax=Limosilactobacillus caecicola TaxID=2941332 RepID=UPI00389919D7
MKFVAIAGSIAPDSYNRKLVEYIRRHYRDLAEIEVLPINDVPMFNEDHNVTHTPVIQNLNQKIAAADGVILATPEHDHTTTAALKSVLEWLSYQVHPFNQKPVLIVGASYFSQGTSRAQLDLRQIMEAPGVGAYVMPGDEFLLGNVREAFDDQGNLKDQRTVDFLTSVMKKFVQWVSVLSAMDVLNLAAEQEQVAADTTASASVTDEEADTDASASITTVDDANERAAEGSKDDQTADTGASASIK